MFGLLLYIYIWIFHPMWTCPHYADVAPLYRLTAFLHIFFIVSSPDVEGPPSVMTIFSIFYIGLLSKSISLPLEVTPYRHQPNHRTRVDLIVEFPHQDAHVDVGICDPVCPSHLHEAASAPLGAALRYERQKFDENKANADLNNSIFYGIVWQFWPFCSKFLIQAYTVFSQC